MTIIERKAESIRKEIEKYQARLDRNLKLLEKKTAIADKVGANWTPEEFLQHRDKDMTQKQWAAYFEKGLAEDAVKEAQWRLENAQKRLNQTMPKVEEVEAKKEEDERVNDMENKFYTMSHQSKEEREAEYEAWVKWFKAECLKDGVKIEKINGWGMSGKTKSGKHFVLYGNSGYTERSWHCYTLRIESETIFTSGEFSTAYNKLK